MAPSFSADSMPPMPLPTTSASNSARAPSDEEVDIRLVGFAEVRRGARELDAVDELLRLDAHDVHRHRAGDELDVLLARRVDQFLEREDVGVAHRLLHQLRP